MSRSLSPCKKRWSVTTITNNLRVDDLQKAKRSLTVILTTLIVMTFHRGSSHPMNTFERIVFTPESLLRKIVLKERETEWK